MLFVVYNIFYIDVKQMNNFYVYLYLKVKKVLARTLENIFIYYENNMYFHIIIIIIIPVL